MYTLGINAAFHDPAACLVRDGIVLAAAEEERFTHIKHGKRPVPFSAYELPYHAIDFCLAQTGIRLADVDHVAYSYDPSVLLGDRIQDTAIALPLQPSAHRSAGQGSPWESLFLAYIVNAPRQLAGGAPHHLRARFEGASPDGPYRWHFVSHHTAHAASAFHASPYRQAAVLTLDGRGELATTTYSAGEGTELRSLGEVHMPHSLGILYEEITTHLGFLHSSDEYKVMALASYGKPRYAGRLRELVRVQEGGRYAIAPLRLTEWFGPARQRGGPLEQQHYDLARSVQVVLEETVLALADWLRRASGMDRLCVAGGVALNCVMNARLRDRGPFSEIWVQPAAGDAGTALGAALWVDARERALTPTLSHRMGEGEGEASARPYTMTHAFLGPAYGDDEIESVLGRSKLPYRRLTDVADETAALLEADRIIGWFQGGMEFGPRALGARSILASPLQPSMQDRLNDIKDREDFRPVAPVVLEEEAAAWFTPAGVSPFMLFVCDVLPDKANRIPAVRHVDGTARVQTINRAQHARYYDLLKAFERRTGVPVLVNTSFNTQGKPIVCTPRDALESFCASPLDALVIGSFVLEKHR
jgi:carbamoyltransferase